MKNDVLCPICEEGLLKVQNETSSVEYKGESGEVPFTFCVCESCGIETVRPQDAKSNKRAFLEYKKSVDGLLSYSEVKRIRNKYGVKQADACRLFGGGPNAFTKYEHSDVAQSEAMDSLLRLIDKNEYAFWDLVEIKGLSGLAAHQIKKQTYSAPTGTLPEYEATDKVISIARGRKENTVSRKKIRVDNLESFDNWGIMQNG